MPNSWSKKDERQYEHIKDSYESRGRSESKAEELAARTVNKERREEGRTKSSKSKKKD
jgi:plasmid stabilization system protein ParE